MANDSHSNEVQATDRAGNVNPGPTTSPWNLAAWVNVGGGISSRFRAGTCSLAMVENIFLASGFTGNSGPAVDGTWPIASLPVETGELAIGTALRTWPRKA